MESVVVGLISDIHFGELARSTEFALPGQSVKGETSGAKSMTEGLVSFFQKKKSAILICRG